MSLSPEPSVSHFNIGHGLLTPRVLYVSDLDGTLLDSHGHVTPRSADMLNRAIAHGTLFTIATARTPATVIPLLKDVNMRLPGVVMTGAALFHFSDRCFSRICTLPASAVKRLIPVYRRYGVATFIYTMTENHIDVYHIGELNQYEKCFIAERANTPVKKFHVPSDGESVLPDSFDNTVLLFSVQPWDKAFPLYSEVKDSDIPCTPLCYHDAFGEDWGELEIFGPHTGKGAAIEALASDIGASRIVAFGDNVNDIPLFDLADRGVAVANAIDELKEKASEVIETNDRDAVASYILKYSL